MMISWEYGFYPMIFTAERVCQNVDGNVTNREGWNPEDDFKGYLENLAVEAKWFESDDTSWKAERFEMARIELLKRIEILPEGEGDVYESEQEDESGDYQYLSFPRWKMCLKEIAEEVSLPDNSKQHIYADRNCLNVNKVNPVNLLFDWLLGVGPQGAYGNDFYIGAYGITEYDETWPDNYLFMNDPSSGELLLQSGVFKAVPPQQDNDSIFGGEGLVPYHQTAQEIRQILCKMHPAGELPESK